MEYFLKIDGGSLITFDSLFLVFAGKVVSLKLGTKTVGVIYFSGSSLLPPFPPSHVPDFLNHHRSTPLPRWLY
jgi:hypothetical protein